VDPLTVCLEVGRKRTFASALQWPGWCRSARGEEAAVAELLGYAGRYAPVARAAGLELPDPDAVQVQVVETVPGDGTTDFGAPGRVCEVDRAPTTADEAGRQVALVRAAWELFDEVVAATSPTLRKGPRGGGRDRDPMVDHVLGAEAAYARKLGVRLKAPDRDDRAGIEELRTAVTQVLGAPSTGEPPVPRGWPPRYAARRIAWHVLDHAWEMEDKREP
jgi:hypothetical protein